MVVPDSVREIDDFAFSDCKDLASVTFGEKSTMRRIGIGAFYETQLECFSAPDSLEEIDCVAFCGCSRLAHVALNSSI